MEFKRKKNSKSSVNDKGIPFLSKHVSTKQEKAQSNTNISKLLSNPMGSESSPQFEEFQRDHLRQLITSIKGIQEQINSFNKLNSKFETAVSNSEPKEENVFKRQKIRRPQSQNSQSKAASLKQKEMNDLKEFLTQQLEAQKTKNKIDLDKMISAKKVEHEKNKKEMLENNAYIISSIEDEFKYYLAELEAKKREYIERKKSEGFIEKSEKNINKVLEVKNYMINEYYSEYK